MKKLEGKMFRFHRGYITAFFILFLLEVIIAVFFHDNFIRLYLGDILVIVLLYCFVESFLFVSAKKLPLYLFLFAVIIEFTQYFHLADRLSIQRSSILGILLGSTFDKKDMICYFLGMVLLYCWQFLHATIPLYRNKWKIKR